MSHANPIGAADRTDEFAVMLPGDALRFEADGPVLVGGCCRACGGSFFPQVPVCPSCMSEDVAEARMPRRGTVYSQTTVHAAPAKWSKPFNVAYVDLDNGVRVFTRLARPSRIGAIVRLAVGEVGREHDGTPIRSFVFEPMED